MRSLLLTPFVPFPLHDGGRIRAHELMRGLAEHHDVEVLALTDGGAEAGEGLAELRRRGFAVEAVPHIQARRTALVRSLVTGRSVYGNMLRSRPLLRRLEERLTAGRFDSVQCEYTTMAPYRRSRAGPPWVLDAPDIEFAINASLVATATGVRGAPYRAFANREARHRRREETDAWAGVDHVVTVSEVDRATIHDLVPDAAITVVPNGVDLDRLRPPEDPGRRRRRAAVLVGKMDYRPNVDAARWFSDEVLPLVRDRVPDFELSIVGRDPTPAVRSLAQRPGVRVTGTVADPVPYLHDASVAVVPLRAGSGSRLKVLEALAVGTPVVSTTAGVEGLAVERDRHVLLADDPAAFADAVVDLLSHPDRGRAMALEGRRLVEDRYGWGGAVRTLIAVHEDLVDRSRSRSDG